MPRPANRLSAEDLDQRYRLRAITAAFSVVRHVWPERSDEAEDIAGEALEKAVACLHQYDATRPFWPWLRRIVQTTAIDRLRRFGGPLLGPADGEVLALGQTPDEAVTNEEERDFARTVVAEAVDTLGRREKEMLLRFYVHDEPFATLAHAFAVAEQTARGAVSRAKHAVLAKLGLPPITNREMRILLTI